MMDLDLNHLFLGQENLPLPGEGAPGSPEGPPADGGAARPSGDPFGSNFLFIILIMVVAMIVFSFLGQRRDRRKRDVMLSALKKHDKVQTLGGVIGSIVEVKKDVVVLKVDESSNTRITFARSAIQQILAPAGGNAGGGGPGAAGTGAAGSGATGDSGGTGGGPDREEKS